ncbi:astroprincin family protein [Variovorax sp. PCZ-1]|uniref:astroprincin family protein n=1 Tax=Variovorax sp. PCZ-1 TaxID=2835533 RepID=UPI001BCD4775|nr:astroprincin family protein [Variovorax sp. PCZ-1]MBS7808500.1 hypothetical protein [Variovorax sp. PCZ-1]
MPAFVLAACGGGGGGGGATDSQLETRLTGQVISESSAPISGVSLQAGGQTVVTGADGKFSITMPNADTETVVLAKKSEFATNAKQVFIVSGKTSDLTLKMFAHQVNTSFAVGSGIDTAVSGARVQIPANAIKTSSGAAYTGTVTIRSSYFSPESLAGEQAFQQPYAGITAPGGTQVGLISVGVIEVKLTDANGNLLQLDASKPATLTYPATSVAGGTDTVPLWYYDESAKIWVREGQVSKQANGTYQGTVTHFTVWNADIQVTNPATIKGCFRDTQGNAVRNGYARVRGAGWAVGGSTGADGNFEVRNAPPGRALEVFGVYPQTPAVAIAPLTAGEVRQLACVVVTAPTGTLSVTPSTSTFTTTFTSTTNPTTSTTASFAGTYTGNYSGAEQGTFSVVISASGSVTGQAFSQTFQQTFPVTGSVGSNGQVLLTASGQAGSSNFSGSISANGVVSGNWNYVGTNTGGTFSGQRQMSAGNTTLLSQYVGTWRTTCEALSQGSTDELFTIATPSSTGSELRDTIRYYSSTNCTGNPVATIAGSAVIASNGTKVVAAQTVVKVDITFAAGAPAFTGSASLNTAQSSIDITINGVLVESLSVSQNAETQKDIYSQPGTGSTFIVGARGGPATLDAELYPISLDTASIATRQ